MRIRIGRSYENPSCLVALVRKLDNGVWKYPVFLLHPAFLIWLILARKLEGPRCTAIDAMDDDAMHRNRLSHQAPAFFFFSFSWGCFPFAWHVANKHSEPKRWYASVKEAVWHRHIAFESNEWFYRRFQNWLSVGKRSSNKETAWLQGLRWEGHGHGMMASTRPK